jgi:MFS transporter, DHA1 family, multidrug resistance protein
MYMSIGNMIGPALAGILFQINVNVPYIFGAFILQISYALVVAWKGSEAGTRPVTVGNK